MVWQPVRTLITNQAPPLGAACSAQLGFCRWLYISPWGLRWGGGLVLLSRRILTSPGAPLIPPLEVTWESRDAIFSQLPGACCLVPVPTSPKCSRIPGDGICPQNLRLDAFYTYFWGQLNRILSPSDTCCLSTCSVTCHSGTIFVS